MTDVLSWGTFLRFPRFNVYFVMDGYLSTLPRMQLKGSVKFTLKGSTGECAVFGRTDWQLVSPLSEMYDDAEKKRLMYEIRKCEYHWV